MLAVCVRDPAGCSILRGRAGGSDYWHPITVTWLVLGMLTLSLALWTQAHKSDSEIVHTSRNFYGVLTVYEHQKTDPAGHHFLLQHGRITHGLQFVDPQQASWPTTYYGAGSGIDRAVHALTNSSRRIGVVGLGTGTIAAFGQKDDYLRIYEINPQVQQLANSRFNYLSNCPAKVEVALGDARLSMEREPAQQFDLLALDAFSSDAIPVHLLTKEAFDTYEKHLRTNGIIAVHISNHYLDLEPVVVNVAHHFNYRLAMIDYEEDEAEVEWWLYSSTWILLSHSQDVIGCPVISAAAMNVTTNSAKVPFWTDDFASLFQILKK